MIVVHRIRIHGAPEHIWPHLERRELEERQGRHPDVVKVAQVVVAPPACEHLAALGIYVLTNAGTFGRDRAVGAGCHSAHEELHAKQAVDDEYERADLHDAADERHRAQERFDHAAQPIEPSDDAQRAQRTQRT